MKPSLSLALSLPLFLCALPGPLAAAPSPLRVLFLGDGQAASRDHCHVLMKELGRDAVWFDYASDPAQVTPASVGQFDAVLVDGPSGRFPALAGLEKSKLIPETFPAADATAAPAYLKTLQEKLLAAAGPARQAERDAFLAQREPEQREVNPNVANYEQRPKPLTFQLPLSVKASMERTQVAPDLKLELFASEPDITKPIALAWDARGRCWVAETSDYPHGVAPDGKGNDRIKICEDTDGDGKADKFTVFAGHLNIPTSLTFANGGLIVSQPPRFLFLKDTDGDDKADVREDLITGWGIGDTHAQASNLHYGIDNWFYGCVGYSGFNGEVGGKRQQFAQGTYRFKADGSALEFLHQFTNNSWGQSANDAGDQYGGTANGAPIFYGGIPASLVPAGQRVMTAQKINTGEKVHTITPNFRQVDVMGGYTAAAGSNFIYSDKLPARLQGMAMVCEPTMKVITLMDVKAAGAGATAGDGFNLVASSDEWMSPVFADVGPDGAVWFADWQNFIIQHNPTPTEQRGGYNAKTGGGGAHENDLRDHSRGRIYRITSKTASQPNQPVVLAGPDSLVAALSSSILERRLQAQRLLVDSKATATIPALKKLVLANDGNLGALHALWTLQAWNALEEADWTAALYAKDARLRRNAIRALGSDPVALARYFGSGVVNDPDLTTRLAALVKLADFPTTPEIQTLVKQLSLNPVIKGDGWLNDAARLLLKKHKAEAYQEGPNLLTNSSFETTGPNGLPQGWKRRDYNQEPGTTGAKWSTIQIPGWTHTGDKSIRCITSDFSDTSLYTEVTLKPDTEYRLSAWIKTNNFRGKASLNDHINRHETEKITRTADWTKVETTWNTGANSQLQTTINLLHVAKGDSHFDDITLCELSPIASIETLLAGDAQRGSGIFWKHPVAACVNCHMLTGKGSAVGPPLDGIATRKDAAYITESLLEPNAKLAETYTATPISPMPPMGLILKPQELEDIKAFLMTLK
jgi:putative membrane-bound dehydrogenase-like protein